MNYVRKLGFEEAPDYDFLRELFTKVLKNSGEQDDGIYDWMLLNGGKGWEASNVRHHLMPLLPCAVTPYTRRPPHRYSHRHMLQPIPHILPVLVNLVDHGQLLQTVSHHRLPSFLHLRLHMSRAAGVLKLAKATAHETRQAAVI